MSDLTRREFLKFVGASGAIASMGSLAMLREAHASGFWFTPVRIPSPLPIYTTSMSWLGTDLNGVGEKLPASPMAELPTYEVIDDVIVPPEYERYIIVQWGDRVYPSADDYFGFNNDHTGYVPIRGSDDGFLVVNHEYTSYPFHQLRPGTNTGFGNADHGLGNRTFEAATGLVLPNEANIFDLTPEAKRQLYGEQCYNMGLSVLRVRRKHFRSELDVVSGDWRNRRVHLLSGLAVNQDRTDGYQTVVGWGPTPHETGDDNYLVGTGPAATQVFNLSSDGLGNKIIGTGFNCSGGTTPWGTVVSAEENFQGSVARFTSGPNVDKINLASSFYIGVQEEVKPDGTQLSYIEETTGAEFGQVGEKYGWLVEIDPRHPDVRVKKHTALGRFRHENIAIRAEAGSHLVCYMFADLYGCEVQRRCQCGAAERRDFPAGRGLGRRHRDDVHLEPLLKGGGGGYPARRHRQAGAWHGLRQRRQSGVRRAGEPVGGDGHDDRHTQRRRRRAEPKRSSREPQRRRFGSGRRWQPGRGVRQQLDVLHPHLWSLRGRARPVRHRPNALRDDRAHLRRQYPCVVGPAPR